MLPCKSYDQFKFQFDTVCCINVKNYNLLIVDNLPCLCWDLGLVSSDKCTQFNIEVDTSQMPVSLSKGEFPEVQNYWH